MAWYTFFFSLMETCVLVPHSGRRYLFGMCSWFGIFRPYWLDIFCPDCHIKFRVLIMTQIFADLNEHQEAHLLIFSLSTGRPLQRNVPTNRILNYLSFYFLKRIPETLWIMEGLLPSAISQKKKKKIDPVSIFSFVYHKHCLVATTLPLEKQKKIKRGKYLLERRTKSLRR